MTVKALGGPGDPVEAFTPDFRYQTLVQSAELELEFVTCEAGFGSPGGLHTHPQTEAHYVMSGRFEFNLDGKKTVVSPGDGFLSLGGQRHSLACIESGSLVKVISLGGNDRLGTAEPIDHDQPHPHDHDHDHSHGHDHGHRH